MFFVYVLRSTVNSDLYVGSTENVELRVRRHNAGKVKSTKGYKPWILFAVEEYATRSEAVRRELFFKDRTTKSLVEEKV